MFQLASLSHRTARTGSGAECDPVKSLELGHNPKREFEMARETMCGKFPASVASAGLVGMFESQVHWLASTGSDCSVLTSLCRIFVGRLFGGCSLAWLTQPNAHSRAAWNEDISHVPQPWKRTS